MTCNGAGSLHGSAFQPPVLPEIGFVDSGFFGLFPTCLRSGSCKGLILLLLWFSGTRGSQCAC